MAADPVAHCAEIRRRLYGAAAGKSTSSTAPADTIDPESVREGSGSSIASAVATREGGSASFRDEKESPDYSTENNCSQDETPGQSTGKRPPNSDETRPTLRRVFRNPKPRPTGWVNAGATAADAFSALDRGVERFYWSGKLGSLTAAQAWAEATPEGWTLDRVHHGEHAPAFYWSHVDGATMVGRSADTWFDTCTPDQARRAADVIGEVLAERHPGAIFMASPPAVGQDLIRRKLPDDDDGWPTLDPEHQRLIRENSGQHRIETVARSEALPALYMWDARLAFSALTWGLGRGPATLDDVPEYAGQTRGRYEIEFTVPNGWHNVGLFAVKDADHVDENGDSKWWYPSEPGSTHTTWVDGAELHVAYKVWHPDAIRIKRRLLLADHKFDPLGKWAPAIAACAQASQVDQAPELRPLLRSAWRAILVQTIGSLVGKQRKRTHMGPFGSEPADAIDLVSVGDDRVSWATTEAPAQPEMCHPEAAALVWARQRARVLCDPKGCGALGVDPDLVVGFYGDAIYLNGPTDWAELDDKKPGRFRLKGYWPGPHPAPTNHDDLVAIRQGAKSNDEQTGRHVHV